MSDTRDRFQGQVDSITAEIRQLQQDQAAVTWRGPQWRGYQQQIDDLVAARRRSERALPAMRRTDRMVTVRLVLVLLVLLVVVGLLAWFVNPWFWAGEVVLGALVWGVLSSPR